jgi:putative oxidoreductase
MQSSALGLIFGFLSQAQRSLAFTGDYGTWIFASRCRSSKKGFPAPFEELTMLYDATLLDTIGRLLIVGSFLVAGLCNLTPARIKDHVDRMAAFGTPLPAAAFWIGIAILFAGCALLVVGWHADVGAILLIVFTLFATAIFHRFWQKPEPQRNLSRIMFLNNTGILGGLVLLWRNVS